MGGGEGAGRQEGTCETKQQPHGFQGVRTATERASTTKISAVVKEDQEAEKHNLQGETVR